MKTLIPITFFMLITLLAGCNFNMGVDPNITVTNDFWSKVQSGESVKELLFFSGEAPEIKRPFNYQLGDVSKQGSVYLVDTTIIFSMPSGKPGRILLKTVVRLRDGVYLIDYLSTKSSAESAILESSMKELYNRYQALEAFYGSSHIPLGSPEEQEAFEKKVSESVNFYLKSLFSWSKSKTTYPVEQEK